jgi:arylsulfatase A-like enzyme
MEWRVLPSRLLVWIFALAVAVAGAGRALAAAPASQQNFVILLADDLGYGDLGSYGHPVIRTPSIDELAATGQRWTDFYTAAPVCTPSRGALLTGRLPIRLGLVAPAGMPDVFFSFSTGGLPTSELTLPEILRAGSYATALIGKWHLGLAPEFQPRKQGFDHFFGTLGSNDMDPAGAWRFESFFQESRSSDWNVALYRNEEIVERPAQQETLTARYTADAIRFIETNRERPFFLLLSYNMPHVPLFASAAFRGRSPGGPYADAVEEIDWSVGQVVGALSRLGLAGQTVVMFTSDNGPARLFRERGGSAGHLRGGKGTTWEGGFRVPTIFWAPGRIAPGTVHDIGSQLDLVPTLVQLAGLELPRSQPLDGVSLASTLLERAPGPRDRIAYFRHGEVYALRKGRYKAHFVTEGVYGMDDARAVHEPPLVFDLAADPGEQYPLATPDKFLLQEFAQLRSELQKEVTAAPSELVKGVPSDATK